MVVICRLRALREQQHPKLSLRALSRETGVALSTLSKMERDKTGSYDRTVLDKLCAYFQARGVACEVADLLQYEPDGGAATRPAAQS